MYHSHILSFELLTFQIIASVSRPRLDSTSRPADISLRGGRRRRGQRDPPHTCRGGTEGTCCSRGRFVRPCPSSSRPSAALPQSAASPALSVASPWLNIPSIPEQPGLRQRRAGRRGQQQALAAQRTGCEHSALSERVALCSARAHGFQSPPRKGLRGKCVTHCERA